MISPTYQAPDPDWDARVRTSFAKQGAMRFFGAEIAELTLGNCSIALPYRAELSQQHGYFHAGITSAIADTAGGYAALTLFPVDYDVLTVEFKVNLIAPAHGGRLLAEASVVRSGRTLTICTVDVCVERDGERTPVGLMQQTLIRIGPK
ncbi:MAG: PaaI family thioesterase [Vulcanimicrobiaceae bacterium]